MTIENIFIAIYEILKWKLNKINTCSSVMPR